jgi:hypothetical protein
MTRIDHGPIYDRVIKRIKSLEVPDSDGRRNLDEDTIADIGEMI